MRLFFISIFMLIFISSSVASIIGSVEQLKGNVKVKSEGSIKKSKVKTGLEIHSGDMIMTYSKASAVIRLVDGSEVILDAKSTIHFKSPTDTEQLEGKIYYHITSRSAKNRLNIKTPFAIIGIKGTTFVVNATKNQSVTLKEGLIGVKSIKEEFNLYRKAVEEEFNKYMASQISEFEKFKNKQNRYASPIKTKAFDLQAGNRISFSDKRVNEDEWNKSDDEEFKYFETLMNQKVVETINIDENKTEIIEKVELDNNSTKSIKKVEIVTEDNWSDNDELDSIGNIFD